MPAEFSAEDLKQEIVSFLEKAGKDAADLGSDLDDFAAIGSLMTDQARCIATLSILNGELELAAKKNGMIEKNSKYKLIVRDDGTIDHKKILTNAFSKFEAAAGFNRGMGHKIGGLPKLIRILQRHPTPQGQYLPPGPATLTRFVPAGDFRDYLLKHAYHWKDAGVGVAHGEFTHRAHWYIIVKEFELGSLTLTKRPVDLFKRLAEPETIGLEKGIWDLLVDYQTGISGTSEDQKRIFNTFRRPETLHAFFNSEATHQNEQVWVLSQLIAGRTKKRRLEKKNLEANYAAEVATLDNNHAYSQGSIMFKPSHEKRWG